MVQQSGAGPCFSLIMGFHSLVHRLPMEPKCIKRRMDFHTRADRQTDRQTQTHTPMHIHHQAQSHIVTHTQLAIRSQNHLPMEQVIENTFKAH